MTAMLASPATACVYRGTLVHSVAIGKVKVCPKNNIIREGVLRVLYCFANEEFERGDRISFIIGDWRVAVDYAIMPN